MLHLQRAAGNAGIAQLLGDEQQAESPVKGVVGHGGGEPLDAGIRQRMESSFGADFSDVRVHAGGEAASSAQAVDAHAYTVGNEVVLGAGHEPGSPSHERTMAHELTHVAPAALRAGRGHRGARRDPPVQPERPLRAGGRGDRRRGHGRRGARPGDDRRGPGGAGAAIQRAASQEEPEEEPKPLAMQRQARTEGRRGGAGGDARPSPSSARRSRGRSRRRRKRRPRPSPSSARRRTSWKSRRGSGGPVR